MKVLVVQQRYGIGDMVIFSPYIQAISNNLKTSVTLLAKKSSRARDLFAYDKAVNEIIDLEKSLDKVSGFFDQLGKMVLPDAGPQYTTFDVVVKGNGRLGIDVAPKESGSLGARVKAINGGIVGDQGKVIVGDQITTLNGVNVQKLPFKTIVQMLKTRDGREMRIEFTRLRSPTKMRNQLLDMM